MTILGKILVILNLVFALVVGGLVVVVYSRSTNWEAAYHRADEYYKAARADADQSREDAKKARADQQTFQADVNKRLKEEDTIRENLKGELAAAKKEADDAKDARDKRQRELDIALEDGKRLQQEKETLETALKQRDEQNKTLLAKYGELNQEATTVRLLNESLRDRNMVLAKQLKADEDIIKNNKLVTPGPGGGTPVPVYPDKNVDGYVTKVDERNGLLSISLGTDSGIDKDQTLDVWRIETNNNAKYLGTIRILNAEAKQAVARPDKDRVQLKVGDHVGNLGR